MGSTFECSACGQAFATTHERVLHEASFRCGEFKRDEITPRDLLRLALAEFARFDELAGRGAYEMFASARLARELVAETLARMEGNQNERPRI